MGDGVMRRLWDRIGVIGFIMVFVYVAITVLEADYPEHSTLIYAGVVFVSIVTGSRLLR